MYIAEIAPQNLRGALGSVNQVGLLVAMVNMVWYYFYQSLQKSNSNHLLNWLIFVYMFGSSLSQLE